MVTRTIALVLMIAFTVGAAMSQTSGSRSNRGTGSSRLADGLREALRVGAENAVQSTGRVDGFFRNAAIRILMPKQLKPLDQGLRAVGRGDIADEFVLAMNRAAERAAPHARDIFVDAILEMTFDDARRIIGGGDTAATDYFRDKTGARLAKAFRPVVESAMDDVGATRQYKEIVGRYRLFDFGGDAVDIDGYVVEKALDGLFHVLGEEEKKIRRDPAARVTKILRDVFGGIGG
jgi:hypothetical protein